MHAETNARRVTGHRYEFVLLSVCVGEFVAKIGLKNTVKKLADVLVFAQCCDHKVLTDIEKWFVSQYRNQWLKRRMEQAAVCCCAAEMLGAFANVSAIKVKLDSNQICEILYEQSLQQYNILHRKRQANMA
ncbi:MAG: hypothetical protein A2Y07_00820 [Planctomycetes bacterium GWF2_50_10]|nr:MAG: hypothetical protein A2Y07_00820 [Planctomycetes bacterium GWF2_50_10]